MAMLLPQVLRSGVAPVRPSRRWLACAGLAAAAGVSGVAYWAWWPEPPAAAPRVEPQSLPASSRDALAECGEHAMLLHDVRWAAACMVLAQQDGTRDDSTECELPPAHAARLNELFHRAEQRCLAEAKQQRR